MKEECAHNMDEGISKCQRNQPGDLKGQSLNKLSNKIMIHWIYLREKIKIHSSINAKK